MPFENYVKRTLLNYINLSLPFSVCRFSNHRLGGFESNVKKLMYLPVCASRRNLDLRLVRLKTEQQLLYVYTSAEQHTNKETNMAEESPAATPPNSWKLPEGIESHIEDGAWIKLKTIIEKT